MYYFFSITSRLVLAADRQTRISSIVDLIDFKFLEITFIFNSEEPSESIILEENDSGSSGEIAESNSSARHFGPFQTISTSVLSMNSVRGTSFDLYWYYIKHVRGSESW